MSQRSGSERTEFGDYQTPLELAVRCCEVVRDQLGTADTVVEPTCGQGTFVDAAVRVLRPQRVMAYEIHPPYVEAVTQRLRFSGGIDCEIVRQDFFAMDWKAERERHDGPVLYLGNPPWVTNSQLGTIVPAHARKNSPRKSNVEQLRGIEAMTGRSNFDISESVLRTLLLAMRPDQDSLAMLIKTATARKVLRFAWSQGMQFSHASLHAIDARQSFGVNTDACLLLLRPSAKRRFSDQVCYRSPHLHSDAAELAFGWADGRLVSNPAEAKATQHLEGDGATCWRSGVKHDLAQVLELTEHDRLLFSRDGRQVDIEMDRVYPLAKGADVANRRTACCRRRLLIPQRTISESTDALMTQLPRTFHYLHAHRRAFEARKSSIYRKRDRFAVFGIGDYTFAPWKVAICGLYKRLSFTVYGPVDGRPVVFDDTVYSLPFETERRAWHAQRLLESDAACRFFNARIFWDAKRPITADLLRQIDLAAVARELGCHDEFLSQFAR